MSLIFEIHSWLAIAGSHRKNFHLPPLAETVQVLAWICLFLSCITFICFLHDRTSEYSICFIPEDWISDLELQFRRGKREIHHHYFKIYPNNPLPWKFVIFYIVLDFITIYCLSIFFIISIITNFEIIFLVKIFTVGCFLFLSRLVFKKIVSLFAPIEERWVREYLRGLKNDR